MQTMSLDLVKLPVCLMSCQVVCGSNKAGKKSRRMAQRVLQTDVCRGLKHHVPAETAIVCADLFYGILWMKQNVCLMLCLPAQIRLFIPQ